MRFMKWTVTECKQMLCPNLAKVLAHLHLYVQSYSSQESAFQLLGDFTLTSYLVQDRCEIKWDVKVK